MLGKCPDSGTMPAAPVATGYSAVIAQITKHSLTLDNFRADNCYLEAVRHDEYRCTEVRGGRSVAFVVNKHTRQRRTVVPPDVESVRTLLLGLDEGSIGMAGVAASAFQQRACVWAKFDMVHRIIRDLKLAEGGCCGKVFEKAKLWSAYIYGLNNRPFGSGSNHTLKQSLLHVFQMTEAATSAHFQNFVTRIGKDFEMPAQTAEDHQRIFNKIFEMKSFTQKLGQPKVSNWFAWNGMAKEQMPEFHATKCVFASTFTDDPDPDEDHGSFEKPTNDPKAQLQAIVKGGGGVRLAYSLMKTDLQKHVKIMYVAEQASWTWYTTEIKENKTPQHAVKYSIKLAGDGWQAELHLWKTLAVLENPEQLRFMEIPIGESQWATKLLMLSWHIVMRRSWSLAKHSSPPESLAGLLSNDDRRRRRINDPISV